MSDETEQKPPPRKQLNSVKTTDDIDFQIVIDTLRRTKIWAGFLSVSMFLASGVVIALGAVIVNGRAVWNGKFWTIGLVYMTMAATCCVPATYLGLYAIRIGVFEREPSLGSLNSALEAQKSFWKIVGICLLIFIGMKCFMFLLDIYSTVTGPWR